MVEPTGNPTQADAAAALLATNRRRRSIRRWIAIAGLPLTLVALLFVGKMLSMYVLAHQSITHFVTGAYAESESAARGLDVVNWFQPFVAPYDIGTAMGAGEAEKLPAARAELERALPLAEGYEVCYVRINLSLVMEYQGDAALAAGDGPRAAEFFGEALQMTVETPEECNSDSAQEESPDPNRDMSDTLKDNQERQQEKQQQSQRNDQKDPEQEQQPKPDEGDEEDETPSQSDLDEIEKKLNQGDQDRENQLGDQGDDGPGGGTDKPW